MKTKTAKRIAWFMIGFCLAGMLFGCGKRQPGFTQEMEHEAVRINAVWQVGQQDTSSYYERRRGYGREQMLMDMRIEEDRVNPPAETWGFE